MKKIITEPQLEATIELAEVLCIKRSMFVGYESEGGLRAMLIQHKGIWGFVYDMEPRTSYSLKFAANTSEKAIRKAINSSRTILTTPDPSEFARWYTHSLPTRYAARYIVDLMWSNHISLLDVCEELMNSHSKREIMSMLSKLQTKYTS